MEEIKQKLKQIEAGRPTNPLDELKPAESSKADKSNEATLTHTQFVKWAQEAGYQKQPKEPTESQKIIRQAVISFFAMAAILWVDWLFSNTIDNDFIGTWQGFVGMLKITTVLFTQIVLAKIKQYYENTKTGQK